MMFDTMWKGIFLCVILVVGDPFVTLKAQVPVNEVAHTTSQTGLYVL
jgi:hypothetical protein